MTMKRKRSNETELEHQDLTSNQAHNPNPDLQPVLQSGEPSAAANQAQQPVPELGESSAAANKAKQPVPELGESPAASSSSDSDSDNEEKALEEFFQEVAKEEKFSDDELDHPDNLVLAAEIERQKQEEEPAMGDHLLTLNSPSEPKILALQDLFDVLTDLDPIGLVFISGLILAVLVLMALVVVLFKLFFRSCSFRKKGNVKV